ncbi:hypothetical protein [Breoghania sp.]|uniref:hypothetical protein n=1 Tax=Breoghania sp. TaxID=2065378 RepID=UPI0029C9E2C3|nr:hypothetical protein [Breoghania sp.]
MRILIVFAVSLLLASCAGTKVAELSERGTQLNIQPGRPYIATFFRANGPTLGDFKRERIYHFCPVGEDGSFEGCREKNGFAFEPLTAEKMAFTKSVPVAGMPGWRMFLLIGKMNGTGLHAFTNRKTIPGTLPNRNERVGTFSYTAHFAPDRIVVIPPSGTKIDWAAKARESLMAGLGSKVSELEFVQAERVSIECKDVKSIFGLDAPGVVECKIID